MKLMRDLDRVHDPDVHAALLCQAAHWHQLALLLERSEPPAGAPVSPDTLSA